MAQTEDSLTDSSPGPLSESLGICAGSAQSGPRQCTEEINDMTPQAVCKAVKEKKKGIWDAVSDIAGDVLGGFEAAYAPEIPMMNALTSIGTAKTDLQNKLGIKIKTDTIINQVATCDQIIDQEQSNVITGTSAECVAAWAAAGFSPKQIQDALKVTVSNVTQINTADAHAECSLNMAIEALSQMDASIDNLAMQETLSEAKGLLAKTSAVSNQCNEVNEDQSACKYIQQQSCCAQVIHQNQQNVLDVGCSTGSFKDINQTNTADSFSSCQMTASSSVTDTTSADITNKTEQTTTAEATGLDMSWIILIAVVIIGGGVAGKMVMGKKKGKEPVVPPVVPPATGGRYTMSRGGKAEDTSGSTPSRLNTVLRVAGILEVIAGIVCIILYITTKKKAIGPVIDKPFVRCEQTQVVNTKFKNVPTKNNATLTTNSDGEDLENPVKGGQSVDNIIEVESLGTARSTFGQIKEKAQKDSSIIGYDFFPDDISINPKDIPDSQLGLGVFLSNVDSEDREKYNCPPINTEEERSISMLKEESDTKLLIAGIILVIGGIIQMLVTLF